MLSPRGVSITPLCRAKGGTVTAQNASVWQHRGIATAKNIDRKQSTDTGIKRKLNFTIDPSVEKADGSILSMRPPAGLYRGAIGNLDGDIE